MTADREELIARLERISASAKLLAKKLTTGKVWYETVKSEASLIRCDAMDVHNAIAADDAWAAGDR